MTTLDEINRRRREYGLPPKEPTPEPTLSIEEKNQRRREYGLDPVEMPTAASTPAAVAPTPSPSPLGETGASRLSPHRDAPVEPSRSLDVPSGPSFMDRVGGAIDRASLAVGGVTEDIPAVRDVLTPADPNSMLGRIGAPGQLIETAGDVADVVSMPFEAAAENVWQSVRGIPQDVGSVLGIGEARMPESPIQAIETYRGRPLGEQVAIGLIDPTLAGGQAGRAGQAVARGIGEGAERLVRATAQVAEAAPLTPESKLAEVIRAAKPARAESEALKSAELRRRVGAAAGTLESGYGREAFQRARGPLAGELPVAQFDPPEVQMTPDEVTSLFEKIRTSDKQFFQKLNTSTALEKVMLGQIPQRGEIKLLEDMFGRDLAGALLSKRPFGTKAGEFAMDALNVPRSFLTAYDMSAPFRQGAILGAGHPVKFAQSFVPMMKAFAKEDLALGIDATMRNHPNFAVWQDAGGYHADLFGISSQLASREEGFMSRLASRFPGIRQSERGYVTFLNKLRFDVFNGVYEGWQKAGKQITEEDMRSLATFINRASGRGELGGLDKYAPILNATFFSPRLQSSRILTPMSLLTSSPAVRKEAARDLGAFLGTGMAVLGMLKLTDGADVEADPRSSDFGKIRVGPSRLDFWAGYQPYARLAAQLATGQRKAVGSGNVSSAGRGETIKRFFRSKMAPVPGMAWDVATGETFLGEDITAPTERFGVDVHPLANQAINNLAPLFIQDLAEAVDEAGLTGGFMASPAFFGTSATTFRTVEDVAQETYGKEYQTLWPFQQRDVRAALEMERPTDPTGYAARRQQLDSEEATAMQQLEQMARRGGFNKEIRNTIVGQYFDITREYDVRRDELATNEFGESEVARAGGGTDLQKAALQEYYTVADQATFNGVFISDRYNQLMKAYEQKWARQGTLDYVRANTNTQDIPPALFRILPESTQRRYYLSVQARNKVSPSQRRSGR